MVHFLSLLLFIFSIFSSPPLVCATNTQPPLRIVRVEQTTITKRMTGAEIVAPIGLKLVPAIATLIVAAPLSPIICTGCAVAATGWALWSGFKQTQEKIKRDKARELAQSQQKHSAQFGDDTAAPPDNSNVVVVGFYHPPPEPEDPEKDKKKQGPSSQQTNEHHINQTSIAILKNGYYEVNGFKFSKYYYKRLWTKGRPAPSLIAREILDTAKHIIADIKKGFLRYSTQDWEMVYNPTTHEVWHLQQLS